MIQRISSQANIIQAEVLKALMGTRSQKATLAEICKSTGLSKKDSKWAIKELRSSGVHIDSRKGYEITNLPDSIPAPLFLCGL